MKMNITYKKLIAAIVVFAGVNIAIAADVKVKNVSQQKVVIDNPQGKMGPVAAEPGQEVTLTDEQYSSTQVQAALKNGTLKETENPQKMIEHKQKMEQLRQKIKKH